MTTHDYELGYKQKLAQLKKQTETRVYLIDLNNDISGVDIGDWSNLTDEQWIEISEMQGYVLSLDGFQRAYNKEEIPCETYLRFITITTK
jgi:hypothetical protein